MCLWMKGTVDQAARKLAKRLQSIRPETRVIYMSGYTDHSIVRYGILRQDINYIGKPFSQEGLARKGREVLDK